MSLALVLLTAIRHHHNAPNTPRLCRAAPAPPDAIRKTSSTENKYHSFRKNFRANQKEGVDKTKGVLYFGGIL